MNYYERKFTFLDLQRCSPMDNDIITDYDEYDAKVFDYSKPKPPFSSSSTLAGGTGSHSGRSASSTPHHSVTLISADQASVNSSPEISKSYTGMTKKHSLQDDPIPQQHFLRSVSEDPARPSSFDGNDFDHVIHVMY